MDSCNIACEMWYFFIFELKLNLLCSYHARICHSVSCNEMTGSSIHPLEETLASVRSLDFIHPTRLLAIAVGFRLKALFLEFGVSLPPASEELTRVNRGYPHPSRWGDTPIIHNRRVPHASQWGYHILPNRERR